MKYRLTLALVSVALVGIFTSNPVFSANLVLTKIGNLDLAGKTYSQWWYTGTSPTMYGTSDSGDDIDITVNDDMTYSGVADSSGNWFVTLPISTGDYQISITNGNDTYSFTLHLGQDFPGTTAETTMSTGSGTTVPDTGINQTSAIMLATGISLLALYLYFFESNKRHKVFEREIVGG